LSSVDAMKFGAHFPGLCVTWCQLAIRAISFGKMPGQSALTEVFGNYPQESCQIRSDT
jgi:hypothetical protein